MMRSETEIRVSYLQFIYTIDIGIVRDIDEMFLDVLIDVLLDTDLIKIGTGRISREIPRHLRARIIFSAKEIMDRRLLQMNVEFSRNTKRTGNNSRIG
jgi:hypothetical protein